MMKMMKRKRKLHYCCGMMLMRWDDEQEWMLSDSF